MLGPIGTPELVIILVVVLLIFGVGRISGVGRELGSSIKEFRRAVKDEDKTAEPAASANVQQAQVQQPQAPVQPAPPVQAAPSASETPAGEPSKNIF
jgi:sec-independent protein translocase protein TatA